ncbi:MAG: tripartite tricarboxylate transporter substrate binding protein [Burkholderiales bacterium]|nr:tripartite tricarboxylate transporter substrate binding protein [Burkholderiales bacterium]
MLVSRDLPVDSLQDLIAWLKANPKKASYGWGATVSQLAGGALLARTGTTAAGVAYRSSPQAVTDLLGGQIHFIVLDVTTALAHIKAGRAKGLAVTSPQRLNALPDVPTMAQAGVPDFAAATWVGVFAPSGTPEPIVRRLNEAIRTVQTKTSVPQRMDTCCSASMLITTPAEFGEYVRKDRALWGERITAMGIKPE